MPTAICTKCGASVHWRNQRGATKPTTHGCGGNLIGALNVKVPAEYAWPAAAYYRDGYLDAVARRLPQTRPSWVTDDQFAGYTDGYKAGQEATGR